MFNWGYRHMSPVIYAEEYISEVGDSNQVFDYKFFCYNGVCKNLFITTDRFTKRPITGLTVTLMNCPLHTERPAKQKAGSRNRLIMSR